MTETEGFVQTAITEADPSPRTPTPGESRWGKRFAATAATLAAVGVIVGGRASAVFFIVSTGFLLVFGYCFRGTSQGGPCAPF